MLLPLLGDCQSLINKVYDAADGHFDGEAEMFSNAEDECRRMPAPELLDFLVAMHDRGECPDSVLDGVSETDVKAAACTDTEAWAGGRCAIIIASGGFTCERDFCDTVPTRDAPCMMASQCDQTCNLCGGDGEEGAAGSGWVRTTKL